ncbi:unnamed protein product [Strongylus vulgaris]|uniref:Uncharacterized protein n=1 Tax=Strongylus vulgaris TaxID=40348 RepID=A0A3P7IXD5_STRVU|nr:unnamed protein product [Strongylus vulgaris]
MVLAKDGGSLLRETHRQRLIELAKTLQDNVTVEFRGKIYEFRDLCEPYCELNTAFLAFLKLYDPENPSTYTYPQVEIFGTQTFIGELFGTRSYKSLTLFLQISLEIKAKVLSLCFLLLDDLHSVKEENDI